MFLRVGHQNRFQLESFACHAKKSMQMQNKEYRPFPNRQGPDLPDVLSLPFHVRRFAHRTPLLLMVLLYVQT